METGLDNTRTLEYRNTGKRFLSGLLRICIAAIILYFIISMVTWQNVLTAYQSADVRFILMGSILVVANLGIRTYKWYTMLHSVKNRPSYLEAFGSFMLGVSLGSFTPGEIGEYAGRTLHIANAKRSHIVGLVLLDKAQIFVVTSAAGMISLNILYMDSLFLKIFISLGILIVSLTLLLRMDIVAKCAHHLNASFFKRSWVTNVFDGFTLMQSNQLLSTLICTILFHFILMVQMYFFIQAFSNIHLFAAFIGASAMFFLKSCIPISLGDLGIREAGSIFFFSIYGIPQAAALNASLLLFVVNVLLPSIGGTILIKNHHVTSLTLLKSYIARRKTHLHD